MSIALTDTVNFKEMTSDTKLFEAKMLKDTLHEYEFKFGNSRLIRKVKIQRRYLKLVCSLHEKEIEALLTLAVTREIIDKMERCCICLDNFEIDEKIKKLRCEHIFHVECANTWLHKNKYCPLCRQCQQINPRADVYEFKDIYKYIIEAAMIKIISRSCDPNDTHLIGSVINQFRQFLERYSTLDNEPDSNENMSINTHI